MNAWTKHVYILSKLLEESDKVEAPLFDVIKCYLR